MVGIHANMTHPQNSNNFCDTYCTCPRSCYTVVAMKVFYAYLTSHVVIVHTMITTRLYDLILIHSVHKESRYPYIAVSLYVSHRERHVYDLCHRHVSMTRSMSMSVDIDPGTMKEL